MKISIKLKKGAHFSSYSIFRSIRIHFSELSDVNKSPWIKSSQLCVAQPRQFFTLEGKIVADATIVAVWGNTILSMKTDNNSGGTHLKDIIALSMKS